MHLRILDLDSALNGQGALRAGYQPAQADARTWGPKIRLACSFGRFRRFEAFLAEVLGGAADSEAALTFYGSGDFHHVSLALLRRLRQPCNVLVLDNHPDWMRGVPLMHCGTWLYHAARLPHVHRIFHTGGDVDFDNYYRWMAPWSLLRQGKVIVFPAFRPFCRGRWADLPNEPLRPQSDRPLTPQRLASLLEPWKDDLAGYPLYISLDKDVMVTAQSVVNWDSGHLTLAEVQVILKGFLDGAGGNLIGMDVVGDWSEVRLRGLLRRFFHWTEHPNLRVDAGTAARCNEETNLALLDTIRAGTGNFQPRSRARSSFPGSAWERTAPEALPPVA
jgi:hypothetical protein